MTIIFGALSVAVSVVFVICFERRRYSQKMRRCGKSINWSEAFSRVVRGEGEIIVNQTSMPGNVFWSPEQSNSASIDPSDFLLRNTLLTDCPFWIANVRSLRQRLPENRVIICRGSSPRVN